MSAAVPAGRISTSASRAVSGSERVEGSGCRLTAQDEAFCAVKGRVSEQGKREGPGASAW